MKISKSTLESEVQTYNKIVEEQQKLQSSLNELEQKRLKSWGKLEFIESCLKDEENKNSEEVKDITIDEVLRPPGKKKKV